MKTLTGYQKGVNLGGWLSQSPTDDAHYMEFITEDDFRKIQSWGMDHVRLPIDFECVENADGTRREIGYERIHQVVAWCRKYQFNLILDLHKTFGYSFDDLEYSGDFFDNTALQDRFIHLWDNISREFAPDTDIMIFELLNEVVRDDVIDEWNAIAQRCIDTIRVHAPEAMILLGGVGYNAVTSVPTLKLNSYDHICFNFHCYAPMLFTHQGAYWVEDLPQDIRVNYPAKLDDYEKISTRFSGDQNKIVEDDGTTIDSFCPEYFASKFMVAVKAAEEKDVPLYCGEYGVIDQADPASTVLWYKDINAAFVKYGIGRAAWNYKEKDFGLSGDHYASVIDEIVKYM